MGPTITQQEKVQLASVFGKIAKAQAKASGKFLKARSGVDSELLKVGLDATDLAVGRTAGAKLTVNKYDSPQGKGWFVDVRLTRGGKNWAMSYHGYGPELYFAQDWHEIPAAPVVDDPLPPPPPRGDPIPEAPGVIDYFKAGV